MDKFLLKIVIPTYNGENCISILINSIISQTYKNWFIQILDDQSIDNTINIIKEYCIKYPNNIQLIIPDKKLYTGGIRNESVKHFIDTEYTWFIDQDDYLPNENIFQIIYDEIQHTHADIYTLNAVQFKFDKIWHHAPWLRIVKTELVSPTFFEGSDNRNEDIPAFYNQFDIIPDDKIIHIDKPLIFYSGSHNFTENSVERRTESFKTIPQILHKDWLIYKREVMRQELRSKGQNV